ncbi:hypothetical protein EMIHUDRAFT_47771, partial [Emiliania huxleyi CCMP1516]
LVCAQCGSPISTAEELCTERVDTFARAVYAYELDVLDEEAWCYSATNPSDTRFDVARFRLPADAARACRLRFEGVPTAEHSWFPPFLWSMACCERCRSHLGWAFHREGASTPEFVGLILTHL